MQFFNFVQKFFYLRSKEEPCEKEDVRSRCLCVK